MQRLKFDFPTNVGDTNLAEIGVLESHHLPVFVDVPDENVLRVMEFLTKQGIEVTHEML